MHEKDKGPESNIERRILRAKQVIGICIIEEVVSIPVFIYFANLLIERSYDVDFLRAGIASATVGIISGGIGIAGSYIKLRDAKEDKGR